MKKFQNLKFKIKNVLLVERIIYQGERLTLPELGERSKKLSPLLSIQGVIISQDNDNY